MTYMKNNYQKQETITFIQKKNYVLNIMKDASILDLFAGCLREKEFNHLLHDQKVYHQLFIAALKHLYRVQNYQDMEHDLMMMNSLFSHQDYLKLKEDIFKRITRKTITLQEYCVIRYLIPFEKMTFSQVISILEHQYHVGILDCAKICLLEDEYHLAYQYLLQLDDCQDDVVLDLLCSYSMKDYLSLIRHYNRKKSYQFVMSH